MRANPIGVKMCLGKTSAALEAATRFAIVATASRGDARYARVDCDLETGRQHQIRVHLQALGAPVVGDKLYGPDEHLFTRGADRRADERMIWWCWRSTRAPLHAARLELAHPMTREALVIDAPFPKELEEFWGGLEVEGDGGGRG